MNRSKAAVWIGVSGVALLAAAPALGAGFTIGGGTTVTATQTLVSSETGVIAAGGKIDTSGTSGPGVSGQNANTVTNNGEVTAKSDGIVLLDGNQVTNSGVIESGTVQLSGMDGYDSIQAGNNNIIVNTGSITGIDDGIDVKNGNTITNSGSIIGSGTSSWDGVWGIIAGDNNRIYNEAGATVTSGQSEVKLGSNNYVRNSGNIGDSPFGWSIQGIDNNAIVVTSTGTVLGQIDVFNSNTITNDGKIGQLTVSASNKIYNNGTLASIQVFVGTGNYIQNTGTIGQGAILILSAAGLNTKIANTGVIKGVQDGVYIRDGGTLTVPGATGRIEAERNGIRATDSKDAPLVIETGNAIFSMEDGIYAVTDASDDGKTAAITITATGNIDSVNSRGIYTKTAAAEAGVLSVTSGGAVTAKKEGIYAYSASGAVSLTASGSITSQTRSAIMAAGGGNATVTVSGAASGAAGFAGVQLGHDNHKGASNTLTIMPGGVVHNAAGLNQLAILGASGNDTVTNLGMVAGNIGLGGGANSFVNAAGGVFTMGPSVTLGGGTIANAGTLSPGGNGAVATVTVTGNLTQSGGGRWVVDVNPSAGVADRINLSGSASLSGTVAINLLNPVAANQQFTILSAAGGVTGNGLVLMEDQSTVARTLALTYPNPNDMVLSVKLDFAAEGLNPNQTRLGGNLNSLYGNAGGMTPVLDALLGISEVDSYKDALNQLSPEAYLQAAMSGVFSAQAFADVLMSCREREGTHAYIAQGQCLWMDAGGGNLSRDQTGDQLGSDQTSWWLGGGGQFAVSDTVHVGLSVRYEHVSQDVGDDASNDGSWGHAGAAVKYTPGPWLLGASLSGGKGGIDTDRNIGIGTVSGKAEGDQDLSYVHGKLRAAYLFDMGQWYAKPILDLDATWMSYGDVSEDGGGGAGLDIGGSSQTVLSATPRLEIGAQLEIKNGTLVRPYLQAGVAFYGDTGFSVDSAFLDAPGGSPTFVTETEMDSVLADISVGLDVLAVENLNVRLSYDGLFGSNTTSNAGTLRLEWRL